MMYKIFRYRHGRKSAQTHDLRQIILVIAAGVVLMLLFYNIGYPLLEGESKRAACQRSIWMSAFTKTFSAGNPLTSPDCEPTVLELKGDDIIKDGEIDQNRASKLIADEMVSCWKMVGQGKYDPFSNYKDTDKPICIICSTIKYDEELTHFSLSHISEEVNKKTSLSEQDKNELRKKYLVNNPLKFLIRTNLPNKDETYFEFLTNMKSDSELKKKAIQTNINQFPILPDSVILVQMIKQGKKGGLTWKVGAAIAGVAISVVGIIAIPFSFGTSSALTVAGWGLIAAIGIGGTSGILIPQAMNEAFSECKKCNAIGGIYVIPPNVPLSDKEKFYIEGSGANAKKYPLCSIIVN